MEEAVEAGMHDFGFVTGRGKRAIADHFDTSYELEKQIEGTGKVELLTSIRNLINNNRFFYPPKRNEGFGPYYSLWSNDHWRQPFAVVLADDLYDRTWNSGVLAQMVQLYNQFRCSIVAIQEVPQSETNKYGVIAGKL